MTETALSWDARMLLHHCGKQHHVERPDRRVQHDLALGHRLVDIDGEIGHGETRARKYAATERRAARR